MFLVEVFVPQYFPSGKEIEGEYLEEMRDILLSKFGGSTAFTQCPVEGEWKDASGSIEEDRVIILQVMCEEIDRAWWTNFRNRWQEMLQQKELMIRATTFDRL